MIISGSELSPKFHSNLEYSPSDSSVKVTISLAGISLTCSKEGEVYEKNGLPNAKLNSVSTPQPSSVVITILPYSKGISIKIWYVSSSSFVVFPFSGTGCPSSKISSVPFVFI